MVGSRSEHSGIIKDGAKLVNAVSIPWYPRSPSSPGTRYGAGNYAMCGKAYTPGSSMQPTAKIAVMGGEQAAKPCCRYRWPTPQNQGQGDHAEEEKELLQQLINHYDSQNHTLLRRGKALDRRDH